MAYAGQAYPCGYDGQHGLCVKWGAYDLTRHADKLERDSRRNLSRVDCGYRSGKNVDLSVEKK